MLLPLVKDLLSCIYNVSNIHGQKPLQTTPALTFFLEQVEQGGDKVKSTFKLTVGPSTVLAGDGPPAEPAKLNTSSTCCDSALDASGRNMFAYTAPKETPKYFGRNRDVFAYFVPSETPKYSER